MRCPFELRDNPRHRKAIRRLALLVALLGLCYLLLLNLPKRSYEAVDFLGYWAAASLSAHRQNPYDSLSMLALERQQGWQAGEPVYSWNPPWLRVLLIPLGLLPFRPAVALWFPVNPLLIGTSVLLVWDVVNPREKHRCAALPLLAAFLFSRTLHTLLEGRINSLVLLRCASFLSLASRRRDYLAGATLALVTVKPHLAYLLLPGVLMLVLLRRRWRVVVGFLAFLLVLLSIASYLSPTWLQSHSALFSVPASPSLGSQRAAPTARGLVRLSLGLDIGLWLSAACLAGFLTFVGSRRRELTLPVPVGVSSIAGLPTSPFGWSTDQVLLLIPIVVALAWTRTLPAQDRWIAALVLLLTYAYALGAWLVSDREIVSLPVPLMVGLLWAYVRRNALPGARMISKILPGRRQAAERQTTNSCEATWSVAVGESFAPE